MRAAAVALVLIVGAAIVLWYGNTLNSWVLGGLIGGLAALLLSIPISLTLFSYLARRHEEQLQAEEEEQRLAAQEDYESPQAPPEVYDAEAYFLPPAVARDPHTTGRNLPAMPVASFDEPLLYPEEQQRRQRLQDYPAEPAPQKRPIAHPRRDGVAHTPARRSPAAKSARYPGFPAYHTSSQRGLHQTMALRAARLEAMQNDAEDAATGTYSTSKRLPAVRPTSSVAKVPQTSRQLQAQHRPANHYRPKPIVEGSSSGAHRALPRPGETSNRPSGTFSKQHLESHTDRIGTNSPQTTGHLRRSPQTGPTQTTRNPHIESQPRNPDLITGSLKNPLVRRAPYMYEDDPLREELAQQLDPRSIQRRSSRYMDYDQEEE